MATEVKIHLATYLKDAGIKATQQQVEKLAKQVETANKKAAKSADELGGAMGKLEGPFGKVQGLLSGWGAKAASVIAAFKIGWDIGSWINDKVITPLFGITDPIEELKKRNRQLKQEAEKAAQEWARALAEWEQGWQAQVDGAEKARQKVEDLTAAYLRMQQAREKVQQAGDNAELLGLQRDKFHDMAVAGSPEQSAQLGKYYDVLIAETEQKQQLARFDREAAQQAVKLQSAEEQIVKARDKRVQLARQMREVDEKLADIQQQGADKYGAEGSVKIEDDLLRRKAALQKQLDAAGRDVDKRESERAALAVEMSANEQARDNIRERTQLEIDERKQAYDQYLEQVEQADAQAEQARLDAIRQAVEQERAERVRMEQELARQRIDDLKNELSVRQQAQAQAEGRQSAAAGGLAQAWSWYRNKDQMQAVLDEKKAQELAEQQWAKDFDRLKTRHRDWRTMDIGTLSAADESVRQVALAKEEKEAADKAVIETAENTRQLAEKIDELLQVKG